MIAGAKIEAHNVETGVRFNCNLAMRGFAVLACDPLGQRECIQLYDPDLGESKVGASTTEHTVLGSQCLLAGDTLAPGQHSPE